MSRELLLFIILLLVLAFVVVIYPSLFIYLGAVVGFSIIILCSSVLYPINKESEYKEIRRLLHLYILFVAFFSGWFIFVITYTYRGIPSEFQRNIIYSGIYFNNNKFLEITGKDDKNSLNNSTTSVPSSLIFDPSRSSATPSPTPSKSDKANDILSIFHSALNEDEKIQLKPINSKENEPKIISWILKNQKTSEPLRINGFCKNIPPSQWLLDENGKEKSLAIIYQNVKKEIKFSKGTKYSFPFTKLTNTFYYNNQIVSEMILDDGIRLSDLIRRSKKEFKDFLEKTNEERLTQEWIDIFTKIRFVREEYKNKDSNLGVLVSPRLKEIPNLDIRVGDVSVFPTQDEFQNQEIEIKDLEGDELIHYGLGFNDSLSFRLPFEVKNIEDSNIHQVVEINFEDARKFNLPPPRNKSEFIITNTDKNIFLDGYSFYTGEKTPSFYAIAKLSDDAKSLAINNGTSKEKKMEINDTLKLGDFQQGILVKFDETSPPLKYFWFILGIGGLLIINVFSLRFLLNNSDLSDRQKLITGQILIWGVSLALITVRLILAYRASLLIPFDVTPSMKVRFQDSFDYSFYYGFVLFTILVSVVSFFAKKRKREDYWGKIKDKIPNILSNGWFSCFVLACLAILVFFLGFIRSDQSIGFLRISLFCFLTFVSVWLLFLNKLSENKKPSENKKISYIITALMLLTIGIQIFWIKDGGTIFYLIPLIFCFGLILFRGRTSSKIWKLPSRLISISLPLVVILFTSIVFPNIASILPASIVEKSEDISETYYYRTITNSGLEDIVLNRRAESSDDLSDIDPILRNARQNWQMLQYSAKGISDASGYGQSPLSKIGMNYPTSMTDCAFSVYFLSEHGLLASIFLVILYLLLGFVPIWGGMQMIEKKTNRLLILVVIGSYFSVFAFFMIQANLGYMIFTGQNVPFLSLNSRGDIVSSILLCLAAFCLLFGSQSPNHDNFKENRHSKILCIWILAGLSLWGFLVIGQMGHLWFKSEQYMRDFELKSTVLDKIDDRTKSPIFDKKSNNDKNVSKDNSDSTISEEFVWKAETLKNESRMEKDTSKKSQESSLMEEAYAKQFNERVDKYNPSGGLFYFENVEGSVDKYRLAVNKNYFKLPSPFNSKESSVWRGKIFAADDEETPLFLLLGKPYSIALKEDNSIEDICLNCEDLKTNEVTNVKQRTQISIIDKTEEKKDAKVKIKVLELKYKDSKLTIEPYGESRNKVKIFVNGTQISQETGISENNVVVFETDKERWNFLYAGAKRHPLAFVQWRNGNYKRIFNSSYFPFVDLIGKNLDETMKASTNPNFGNENDFLNLTIDFELHKKIQNGIFEFASQNKDRYNYLNSNPNKLSVTILKASDGSILTMGSFPSSDVRNENYDSLMRASPETQRSLFQDNHNLTNHAAASTFKPILFSTMATAFRNTTKIKDIAKLELKNGAGQRQIMNINFGEEVGGEDKGKYDKTDMKDFLIKSRTFPVEFLGFTGLVKTEKDLDEIFIPKEKGEVTYENRSYLVDYYKTNENSVFRKNKQNLNEGDTLKPVSDVRQTLLFQKLKSNFDFAEENLNTDEKLSWQKSKVSSFIPKLNLKNEELYKENFLIDNVLPSPISLNNGEFRNSDEIRRCFDGASICGVNNVRMAEAFARIISGKKIFAKIESSQKSDITPPVELEYPLNDVKWRNENLISILEKVGKEGTASDFKSVGILGYKILFKTGTIQEKDGYDSETLAFIIGKWDSDYFDLENTFVGYLYMGNASKTKNKGDMKKFQFSKNILEKFIQHKINSEFKIN